jgi:drug/metabolite transporter (DMT)-like permease
LSGELAALLSAFVWAVASVLMTVGARRLPVIPLNLVRCAIASTAFWILLPFFGGLPALADISPWAWLWLFVSVLCLLVVGDTLYFRGMDLAGVSWAMPASSIHPIWAVLLASLFVGEPLSWSLAAGAVLVVAGIILVSRPAPRRARRKPAKYSRLAGTAVETLQPAQAADPEAAARGRARRTGVLMALTASLLWGAGQVALKPATEGLDPVVANSARQSIAALILLGLTLYRRQWRDLRGLGRQTWVIIILASLLSTVLGTWLFIYAIQAIGAGRNAVIAATAPMMALPFSMLWLRERPTRWTVVGTLLTTLGIAFVA